MSLHPVNAYYCFIFPCKVIAPNPKMIEHNATPTAAVSGRHSGYNQALYTDG